MKNFFLAGFALVLVLLSGCVATPVGTVKLPEPTPSFSPQPTYRVARDKLWDAVLTTFDNNRIAVASSDKAGGRLQTDYIEGPSALIGGGFIGAQHTRYKFSVALRDQSDGSVKLNILCTLESTIKGSSGASQWNDVSSQNAVQVKKLETWLYEQVEKNL